MIFTITPALGKIPIIVDAEKNTAEVVPVDRVAIISFVTNYVTRTVQFVFAFGGMSSAGRFYLDPVRAQEVVHLPLSPDNFGGDIEQFEAMFFDNGNPKCNFSHEEIASLCSSVLFERAFTLVWGKSYPELAIHHGEEKLFSAQDLRDRTKRVHDMIEAEKKAAIELAAASTDKGSLPIHQLVAHNLSER